MFRQQLILAAAILASSLQIVLAVGNSSAKVVFVGKKTDSAIRDGSFKNPFTSINEALDALRADSDNQDAYIFIREGIYHLDHPIQLSKEDSHLTLSAWADDRVEITGGYRIDNSGFIRLKEAKGKRFSSKSRIKEKIADKILAYDLKKDGIPVGKILKNGFGWDLRPFYPELSVDGTVQSLAGYPDNGTRLSSSQLTCTSPGETFRNSSVKQSDIAYSRLISMAGPSFKASSLPTTSSLWAPPERNDASAIDNRRYETDGWLSGCFAELWSDDNCPIATVVNSDGNITINCSSPSWYGVKNNNLKLRAVNILSELDTPGEYYIDRFNGNNILYYYPEDKNIMGKEFLLSSSDSRILEINGGSDIRIHGIIFSGTSSEGLWLRDCDSVIIDNCELYNIGKDAIYVSDNVKANASNLVLNCHIHDIGMGGVYFSGGNRKKLINGNDKVINCEINNFSRLKTYTPAITLFGMAHKAEYNFIHDAPHMAIRMFGNDHLVAHNHLLNTCYAYSDMAPIYIGRDLLMLGNEVSYNYIENVNPDTPETYGIYFDDSASGGIVRGNILKNIGGSGILPNKGYGYYISDNIFIDIPDSYVIFSTYGTPDWKRPVPNEVDLKLSFYDKLATEQQAEDAGMKQWNSAENIKLWICRYDSLYNSLPYYSKKPQFRFELGKKYFPAADNVTTAFSDPNSLLCGANMTITRNITVNAGDMKIFRTLYGGSNSTYTDPDNFDTRRFRTTDIQNLGLNLITGKIDMNSPLANNPDYGKEWIEEWNRNFTLSGIGRFKPADKSALWQSIARNLKTDNKLSSEVLKALEIATSSKASESEINESVDSLQ